MVPRLVYSYNLKDIIEVIPDEKIAHDKLVDLIKGHFPKVAKGDLSKVDIEEEAKYIIGRMAKRHWFKERCEVYNKGWTFDRKRAIKELKSYKG